MFELKNEYEIYEMNININIGENEFNISQNPTLQSGSFGDLKSFAISDDFNPYVTTIGLYNDSNELLAVAKLGQPQQLSSKTDTVFKIKLDF